MILVINGISFKRVKNSWYEVSDVDELNPRSFARTLCEAFGNNQLMIWVFITNHKLEHML